MTCVIFGVHLWDYNLWCVYCRVTVRSSWLFIKIKLLKEMELVTTRISDPGFRGVTEMVSELSVINLRDDATLK